MYELQVERVFHAAHALRLYDGVMEESHAHDWRVFVHVAAEKLDAIDVVMDFHELERIIDQAIGPLDGMSLNEVEALAKVNPSAERVAEHIGRAIAADLPDHVRLTRLTVTEAPGCRASYVPRQGTSD